MQNLTEIIAKLHAAVAAIESVADGLAKLSEEKKPEHEQSAITLVQVRSVLAEKSRLGYTEQVKALLQKHGGEKLSELDPHEYPALIKEAEVLGDAS